MTLLGDEATSHTQSQHEEASQPRKSPSMLPSILGTFTFQTHASADFGYYSGSAFLVMHVMADPMQTYSCSLPSCQETQNQICQKNLDQCVDMSSTISQWSDVSVFYQYGFEVQSGAYPWRTHAVQNTSDWLGPYSVVLPQAGHYFDSRYVFTIATDYLESPTNNTLVPRTLFDQYAGATAVHNTIQQQPKRQHPTDDPYQPQLGTCQHGDMHPILPRFALNQSKDIQFDFLMLSLPAPNQDPLYKAWPSIQKHLPRFPVTGPYCFQGDPNRAYAINVSFATEWGTNNTWKLTPGCVQDLPCWPSEHPPKPHGGGNDGPATESSKILHFLATYGIYIILVAFIISMTFNCQLSYQLQQHRDSHQQQHEQQQTQTTMRRRRRVTTRRGRSSSTHPEDNIPDHSDSMQTPLLSNETKETGIVGDQEDSSTSVVNETLDDEEGPRRSQQDEEEGPAAI